MRKYLQHFTLVTVLLFALASCKKEDAEVVPKESKLVQADIAGVNGPVTGKINQQLTFSVVWQNADGTAKFDHLTDSVAENTRFIRLYAITNAIDTADATRKVQNVVAYKFKPTAPGVYYLKFYAPDNADTTAIIDTLTIK